MFEGIPTWPDAGRFWDIVDKYKVNILYTAPTAIRSLMSFGLEPLKGKDLSSLKVLGTVGEPINEEAWHWYDENVGKKKCPDCRYMVANRNGRYIDFKSCRNYTMQNHAGQHCPCRECNRYW